MLTIRHNKHIIVHIHFLVPHITPNLRPALLNKYLLSENPFASADPIQHQVKMYQFLPLLTCSSVDA